MKQKPDIVTWEPTPHLRFQFGVLHQYWERRTEHFFFVDEDGYAMECSTTEFTGEWRRVPSQ